MTYKEAIEQGLLTDLKPKSVHEAEMAKLFPQDEENSRGCPFCTGPDDMCNC